jgi:hypothetical protein
VERFDRDEPSEFCSILKKSPEENSGDCTVDFNRNSVPFLFLNFYTGCPKNGVLTVHYGVEEITVNDRKMFKKFYWTYLLIWGSLKVALNRSIILKYMYEIVMTATSNRTYYHKVQDHSIPTSI